MHRRSSNAASSRCGFDGKATLTRPLVNTKALRSATVTHAQHVTDTVERLVTLAYQTGRLGGRGPEGALGALG